MCLILQDSCWVVHVSFVHMFKFKFWAQFPVDHLIIIIIIISIFIITYFDNISFAIFL